MAAKLMTASGALATSGANVRVMKMVLTAGAALGTAVFLTGGSGGTETSITFNAQNGTCCIDLAPYNIIADYLTLSGVGCEAHVLTYGDD